MNRQRYLPPGSMRRQRMLGRLEGSLGALALVTAIGALLVAAAPAEIYRSAPATVRPTPTGEESPRITAQIPPCTGEGKDCADPVRTAPEPGTLALIGAGIVGMIWRARK